jgi:hypothetical protein
MLRREQIQTKEKHKMCFLRAVEGYRMVAYKCNEDIREPGVADIKTTIKRQHKWLDHLKRMPDNPMLQLLLST